MTQDNCVCINDHFYDINTGEKQTKFREIRKFFRLFWYKSSVGDGLYNSRTWQYLWRELHYLRIPMIIPSTSSFYLLSLKQTKLAGFV